MKLNRAHEANETDESLVCPSLPGERTIKFLDLTLGTPAENLACDEALLDLMEEAGGEVIRFWESHQHFVVVGYGNRIETEVKVEECRRRAMPILRRCSGGGTVVQGPGCLNYSVTLGIPDDGPLTSVTGTNELVMERNRATFEKLLGVPVTVQGHTDLACSPLTPPSSSKETKSRSEKRSGNECWLKFSGNAQRRRRRALVFHGTLLYNFDLSLLDALLQFPSAQPEYRASRSHSQFVCNIPAPARAIREALQRGWKASEPFGNLPRERIAQLVRDQYANADWNLRR